MARQSKVVQCSEKVQRKGKKRKQMKRTKCLISKCRICYQIFLSFGKNDFPVSECKIYLPSLCLKRRRRITLARLWCGLFILEQMESIFFSESTFHGPSACRTTVVSAKQPGERIILKISKHSPLNKQTSSAGEILLLFSFCHISYWDN